MKLTAKPIVVSGFGIATKETETKRRIVTIHATALLK